MNERTMNKLKRLWMPVLLGVLLMSTLVGVAGARPNARPEASPALVDYMFSAHHCIAATGTTDYLSYSLGLQCPGATCDFQCPIKPPHEGLIRVQRLAMYVYDNGADDVCIWLGHVYPKTKWRVNRVDNQCTFNDATDPQVYVYNPANFKVSVLQDLVLTLEIGGATQKVYGFKLKYEPL